MGQPPKISILQRFTTDSTKNASSYMHIQSTTMSRKRIYKPSHGTFRTTKRVTHSRKFIQGRIHKIYTTSLKTRYAHPRPDTNSADIHAEDGTAVKVNARRRSQDRHSSNVVPGIGIRRSADSRALFICVANICVFNRLSSDEECFTAANKEVVYEHKLHISQGQLFAVFGQVVGAFGQMVGVGRDYSVSAADSIEGASGVDGHFGYVYSLRF